MFLAVITACWLDPEPDCREYRSGPWPTIEACEARADEMSLAVLAFRDENMDILMECLPWTSPRPTA